MRRQRAFFSEQCKRKSFLCRIFTGDEKWIYFEDFRPKTLWVNADLLSTLPARLNRFHGNTRIFDVWEEQKNAVCYWLLKCGETVNTKCCQQQLIHLSRLLFSETGEISKKAIEDQSFTWHPFIYPIEQNRFAVRIQYSSGKSQSI